MSERTALYRMARFLAAVFIVSTVGSMLLEPAYAQDQKNYVTVLQGLDKVTGHISSLLAPAGETLEFGTLQITTRICHTRPPEETPEVTAFLEVSDSKQGEPPLHLFTGWMFASSPALNALEHPIYDIWVIDCKIEFPDK